MMHRKVFMIVGVITFSMLVTPHSFAKRKIAQVDYKNMADARFAEFQKCLSKYNKEDKSSLREYKSCVSGTIDTRLSDSLGQKIARWLLNVKNIGTLNKCPKKVFRLFPYTSDENQYVKCFDFTEGKQKKLGIMYFATDDDMLIKGIQFN